MNKIRVVDARMGRGKTSAAAAYMESCKGKKHFIYITPYLNEVDRICELCDFEQPEDDKSSKLTALKALLHKKKGIASTHSLFNNFDDEILSLVKENGYSIIIDESIDVIEQVAVSSKDFKLITEQFATEDSLGFLHWIDKDYSGRFSGYKDVADSNSLFRLDSALISIMSPKVLEAFGEVIMMTYLFGGQYQKAYLEYFGFEYEVNGIDDTDGFRFTDKPDSPPALDYKNLITIVDEDRLNAVGEDEYALSKSWYERRGRDNKDVRALRNNLNTFFRRRSTASSDEQLWTCYKSDVRKLVGTGGRFSNSFLQSAAKATNEYRDRTCLAYMINRFADPNITKFFNKKGVKIDEDEFALGEMLQWIWRSCIRDNKPIEIYIPSRRMRTLLQKWIEENSEGETP